MKTRRFGALAPLALVPVLSVAALAAAADDARTPDPELAASPLAPAQVSLMRQWRRDHPATEFLVDASGRVDRIYGRAFANGDTVEETAALVRDRVAAMLGGEIDELVPVGPIGDGHHLQPLMHDALTGEPKLYVAYFTQMRGGIPVHASRLQVVIRNEPGFPAVLVGSDVRELGDFRVPELDLGEPRVPAGILATLARADHALAPAVSDVERVIWAGDEHRQESPAVAIRFVLESGSVLDPTTYAKREYIVDERSGAVYRNESLIHDVDVTGNVSGRATDGIRSGACDPTSIQPMPYARVEIGGTVAFADVNGDFIITNPGTAPVTVTSPLRGRWFRVDDQAQPTPELSETVTPPGPVNFVHNEDDLSELDLAGTNAYIEANRIRDLVLLQNPDYPVIGNQTDWTINVNLNDNCNAFYNGSSINFFTSGGGCPNTSFGTIVHHEYGHHLVNVGGSGQGAYGEGMGDVMGVLIADDPGLAYGFFGNCNDPLRNADNSCQYDPGSCSTCGSAIHSCGQLISGCVWDTRLALEGIAADPRDTIANLAINSILLHSGSSIDPSITIDYLVLDDDDDNILNGTPHYAAIAEGFGLHNMPAPELQDLEFSFPDGRPETVNPSGGTMMRVVVGGVVSEPAAGTGELLVSIAGGAYEAIPMSPTGTPNEYMAIFPPADCGRTVDFYVTAQTTGGETISFPYDAPTETFGSISATDLVIAFEDDFELDNGWTVSNVGGLSDGAWERGVPAGGGDRGDPPTDGDGSSRCFVTDNEDGNSDVDGGTTILTSPIMDASGGAGLVSYHRWYSNTFGASPNADIFEVEVSDDGGATWSNLETVGPGGPEADGGWYQVQLPLGSVPGFDPLTDQFRIRFLASDLGDGSVVEAGVDGVELLSVDCTPLGPVEDLDGDGDVDFDDLLLLLADWGPCAGCPADFDGNDVVGFEDLLVLLAAWTG